MIDTEPSKPVVTAVLVKNGVLKQQQEAAGIVSMIADNLRAVLIKKTLITINIFRGFRAHRERMAETFAARRQDRHQPLDMLVGRMCGSIGPNG